MTEWKRKRDVSNGFIELSLIFERQNECWSYPKEFRLSMRIGSMRVKIERFSRVVLDAIESIHRFSKIPMSVGINEEKLSFPKTSLIMQEELSPVEIICQSLDDHWGEETVWSRWQRFNQERICQVTFFSQRKSFAEVRRKGNEEMISLSAPSFFSHRILLEKIPLESLGSIRDEKNFLLVKSSRSSASSDSIQSFCNASTDLILINEEEKEKHLFNALRSAEKKIFVVLRPALKWRKIPLEKVHRNQFSWQIGEMIPPIEAHEDVPGIWIVHLDQW